MPPRTDRGVATRYLASCLLAAVLVFGYAPGIRAAKPHYDLDVVFDVPQARIAGTASIELPADAEVPISIGDLRILSVTNGFLGEVLDEDGSEYLVLHAQGPVQIRFEGIFSDPERDVIDPERISLGEVWYPVVEGTYRYHLTANLPQEFVAVSEADAVQRTGAGERATWSFDLPYPQRDWDGIAFVASPQWVSRYLRYQDIDLSFHLHRRNADRMDEIVRQTQYFLDRHQARLGRYPFNRLAVVENPVPITYSLSRFTYVLLSQRSAASVGSVAPEDNALNHEIAHQWFGNAVLVDYDGGNWGEGLASYFSDDLENEASGRAWERRQRRMATYQDNVADRGKAFALSGFEGSIDRASKFIGYGKSAIVFHMLRRLLGDERFFAAVRGFVEENRGSAASWTDIRHAFEREAAADLGWFFTQWVDGDAMPGLALEKLYVAPAGKEYELRFTVTQKRPAFRLTVPATVYFEKGASQTFSLPITGEREEFRRVFGARPVRIVLDEGYDIFRRLAPAETPPTIIALLTRQRVALAGSAAERAKFAGLISAFLREGAPLTAYGADTGAIDGANGGSLMLLGRANPLIAKLFGRITLPRGGFTVTILPHPRAPGEVVAILTAVSKAEVDAAYKELVNRPRYSSAAFDKGKLISRELREGQRGISKEIAAGRS